MPSNRTAHTGTADTRRSTRKRPATAVADDSLSPPAQKRPRKPPSRRKTPAVAEANPTAVNPVAGGNHVNSPTEGAGNLNATYNPNYNYMMPQNAPGWPGFNGQALMSDGVQSEAAAPWVPVAQMHYNIPPNSSNFAGTVGGANHDALAPALGFNVPPHHYPGSAGLVGSGDQEGIAIFNYHAGPQYMHGSERQHQYQPYYPQDIGHQMQPTTPTTRQSIQGNQNSRKDPPFQDLGEEDLDEFKETELNKIFGNLNTFDKLWKDHVKEAYDATKASMKSSIPAAGPSPSSSNTRRDKGKKRAEDTPPARRPKKEILAYELNYDYLELKLVSLVWKTNKAMAAKTLKKDFDIFALVYEISSKIFETMLDMSNVIHGCLCSWDVDLNENLSRKQRIEKNLAVYEELFGVKTAQRRHIHETSLKGQRKPNNLQIFAKVYRHRADLLILGALHFAIEFCLVRSWDDILSVDLEAAQPIAMEDADLETSEAQQAFDTLLKLYQSSKSYVQELCQVDRIPQTIAAPDKKINATTTNVSYARKRMEEKRRLKNTAPAPAPVQGTVPELPTIPEEISTNTHARGNQSHLPKDSSSQLQPSAPVQNRPVTRSATRLQKAQEANSQRAVGPTSGTPPPKNSTGRTRGGSKTRSAFNPKQAPPPEPQQSQVADFVAPGSPQNPGGTLEYSNVQVPQIPQARYPNYLDRVLHPSIPPPLQNPVPRSMDPGSRGFYNPHTGQVSSASSSSDPQRCSTGVPAAISTQFQEVQPDTFLQVAETGLSAPLLSSFGTTDNFNWNIANKRKFMTDEEYQLINNQFMQPDQALSPVPLEGPSTGSRLGESDFPEPSQLAPFQFPTEDQGQSSMDPERDSRGVEQSGMDQEGNTHGSGALNNLGDDEEFDLDRELFNDDMNQWSENVDFL